MTTRPKATFSAGVLCLVIAMAVTACSGDAGPPRQQNQASVTPSANATTTPSVPPPTTSQPEAAPCASPVKSSAPSARRQPDLKVAEPGSESAQISALFGSAFLPRDGGAFGADRISVIPGGGPDGGDALRVSYPAGSASARAAKDGDSGYGGAQVYLLLRKGPVDSLHLRYCLRFPVGFDFVKGGKLPGLFGGIVTSGQHIPDGTNGWSTRYMWRRGGAGEVYTYLPSSIEHGTSLGRGNWSIVPGRWQSLEQSVQLNTPGKANGVITVWLDGEQVFKQTRVVFRTTASLHIDGVFFSSFFGGGDASWASPTNQYADFADFSVGSRLLSPPATSSKRTPLVGP